MNDELVCTVEGAAGGEKQSCYTMDRNQAELWLATVDEVSAKSPLSQTECLVDFP